MKRGDLKQVLWTQTSLLSKMAIKVDN